MCGTYNPIHITHTIDVIHSQLGEIQNELYNRLFEYRKAVKMNSGVVDSSLEGTTLSHNQEGNVFNCDIASQQVIWKDFNYDGYLKVSSTKAVKAKEKRVATTLMLSTVRETQVCDR